MPVISMFYGIIIRMFFMDTKQHKMPHLHAEYAGKSAVFALKDGALLAGKFPVKQTKLVQAWMSYVVKTCSQIGNWPSKVRAYSRSNH